MPKKEKVNFTPKALFTLLIVFPFLLALFSVIFSLGLFNSDKSKNDNTPVSSSIEVRNAEKAVISKPDLQITYKDGSVRTYKVADDFRLSESGLDLSKVKVEIRNELDSEGSKPRGMLLAFIPVIVIAFPFIFCFVMLYHALVFHKKYRALWALLILLLLPWGAIAYFFMIYRHPGKPQG